MPSDKKQKESIKRKRPESSLSKRKAFAFRLLLIAFPFVILALLELLLRLFNYGGNLNLVIKEEINGKTYYTLNQDVR